MMTLLGEGVEGKEDGDENDAADEDVEENGESAGFNGRREAGSFRQRQLPETHPECDSGSKRSDPTEHASWKRRRRGCVDEHDGDAGEREYDFGENAFDGGNGRRHGWASGSGGNEAALLSPVSETKPGAPTATAFCCGGCGWV